MSRRRPSAARRAAAPAVKRSRRAENQAPSRPEVAAPPAGEQATLPEMEDLSPEELTARQERAIPALLSERTLAAAARAAGVGERSLRRWLGEDERFRAAYQQARSEAMRQATARIQAASAAAVDTLAELMELKERPDIRARAALGVLAAAFKAEELENLASRVEALEQSQGSSGVAGIGRGWPRLKGPG